ncbi:MAG: DUF1501 domain-containing protein [Nannocystaceae bacterium]|nr:DUF1501 domain-containing protein [bacterium]
MPTITRRNALRLGLGALAAGVTTAAHATHATPNLGTAKACVLLYMVGGASQIDTWDPKPGRPTGGEFDTIRTTLPGVHVSEHLPLLAQRTNDLAILRSLTYREGNHARARYLMHTGFVPAGGARHPGLGAHMHAAQPPGSPLPGNIAIGGPGHSAGFLGPAHDPFVVGNPTRRVRNVEAAVSPARLDTRLALWSGFEADFAARRSDAAVAGHQSNVEQAIRMMRAEELEAFDVSAEPSRTAQRYGPSKFGQGCLMARRLVERGVPFVEVQMGGWDTHESNFERVAALSAELDAAMSALLDDLRDRGLLDETLVVWMGDFGRTPRINGRGGRDHYPAVASAVLAGGGIRGGQVVGATDEDGYEVRDRPISVEDLHRTLHTKLGLDPDDMNLSAGGRPIAAVDGGHVIEEL